MERSGGVAAIVCDATENTVRQGYCYTCLAIGGGGGISVGSLSWSHKMFSDLLGHSPWRFLSQGDVYKKI